MRVLIIARYKRGGYAPFVAEQAEALEQQGLACQFFPMQGKGFWGYLRQLPALMHAIKSFNPDIIHAHYGLCGLFANLQRKVPVVTTYHGSDINNSHILKISRLSVRLSAHNIFVSQKNIDIVKPQDKYSLIPCGINLDDYPILEKDQARKQLGLSCNKNYILFAGAFDNPVKNARLAKDAASRLNDVELLELKGYSRSQIALLMQATDVFLMTSLTEGSPQVVKEALACGCPIVSVDVGDVRERIFKVNGCQIVARNAKEISDALEKGMAFHSRTNGREIIEQDGLSNDLVAKRIINIYGDIIKRD